MTLSGLVLPSAVTAAPEAEGDGERRPVPEVISLWPNAAPGVERVSVTERVEPRDPSGDPLDTLWFHVTRPWLSHHVPDRPNGMAVLLIPGGGYRRVAVRQTGGDIESWLTSLGFHTYVMTYRLPADGWAAGPEVALEDAQRALRLVRARAEAFGYLDSKVGVAGFSAGGHVAGLLANRPERRFARPTDEIDSLSARPDAVALCYPVITLTEPYAHKGSVVEMLGADPSPEARRAHSLEDHVAADGPPTFLWSTTDDPSVPRQNAMMMFEALRAKGVAAELHLFEGNTHGLPVRGDDGQVEPWAEAMASFLSRRLRGA